MSVGSRFEQFFESVSRNGLSALPTSGVHCQALSLWTETRRRRPRRYAKYRVTINPNHSIRTDWIGGKRVTAPTRARAILEESGFIASGSGPANLAERHKEALTKGLSTKHR